MLNAEQHEAVSTTEGPLLVLAGAGSGKTRVIAYRIAYLIQEKHVRPAHILAVTFTNKAAKEMQVRVAQLLAQNNAHSGPPPLISTFHSLCVRILRQHIDKLGPNEQGISYNTNFTIYDADDQAKLIKGCMKSLEIDEKLLPPRLVHSSIGSAKSRGQSWEAVASMVQHGFGNDLKREAISRIYKLYEQRLANSNALDFDDLLLKTVLLLRNSQETRDYYNDRFKYILIDEYQDTNPPQFELIRLLTQKHQNLCVVGDPDQSIYRFRSADIQNILNFEKHYKAARTIKLLQNYRSTKTILETANKVIRNNSQRRDKDLRTENGYGDKIRYFQAYDGDNEAEFIASRISRHLQENSALRSVVLYRTNAQSRLFEEACRRNGLRYNIVGGFSFYERAEVKDTIAYLKLLLNPHDNIALSRVINTPPRGIGKTTLDAVHTEANTKHVSYWTAIQLLLDAEKVTGRAAAALRNFQQMLEKLLDRFPDLTLSDVVKVTLKECGYMRMLEEEDSTESEARLLNLEELVSAAAEAEEREESLRDFLDHAALVSDTDDYDGAAPVTLMTVHSAKGLEFPIVFLAGMEQGLFPHSRSVDNPIELEEERRLCYVAITRAEKYLYISHAANRRIYGEETDCEPSQFLNEMPLELMEDFSRGNSWLKAIISGRIPHPGTANRATASSYASKSNYGGSNYSNNSSSSLVKKNTSNYAGKSYNSTDSVRDFFKQQRNESSSSTPQSSIKVPDSAPSQASVAAKGGSGSALKPGMRVKHPKYGEGLLLRREGDGENAKLLVSFPGFGQKKLVEKFANLVKA